MNLPTVNCRGDAPRGADGRLSRRTGRRGLEIRAETSSFLMYVKEIQEGKEKSSDSTKILTQAQ